MANASSRTADAPLVLRHDDGGITTLTLNRPAQYNALCSALLTDFQAALDAIARDARVRVVIIAGAGKAFCAGHDLKEMRARPDRAFIEDIFRRCSGLMLALTRLPQPVIARVHGLAAAAGCQLVAQCDLAVAGADTRFAVSGINVGLFCATPGVALGRNVPRKQAMEMLLTGDFIDAQRALGLGLLNHVVAPEALDASIAEITAKILAKPAAAIAAGKKSFYEQLDTGLAGAYALATETMVCTMMGGDAAEGIDAFLQKRPPRWHESN
ncbi:MAG: enoyl-CoA hydratase [Burkholderiales bacterium]|nr:enoyl-CoA hydratase [Burkholderiales bacterium]